VIANLFDLFEYENKTDHMHNFIQTFMNEIDFEDNEFFDEETMLLN
jgi:hypothetical protein